MMQSLRELMESWRDAPPGDDLTETQRRHAIFRLAMGEALPSQEEIDAAARVAQIIAETESSAPTQPFRRCCG